jgi:hypothetical protein
VTQVDPVDVDKPELYGFRWGPTVVFRERTYEMGSHRTTRVVVVQPDQGPPIEIHVSSTGKSVRVFREGRELS